MRLVWTSQFFAAVCVSVALLTNLDTTRQNLDALIGGCTADRQDRDAKAAAVRKRISGLIKELDHRLTPLDARWQDFDLNMPGAPSVPAAPRNVVATPGIAGQLQVTSNASTNATSYRFYCQPPIVDLEQSSPARRAQRHRCRR